MVEKENSNEEKEQKWGIEDLSLQDIDKVDNGEGNGKVYIRMEGLKFLVLDKDITSEEMTEALDEYYAEHWKEA